MYPTNGIAGATEAEVADNNLAQNVIYDDAIVERRIVLEIFLDEAPIKRLHQLAHRLRLHAGDRAGPARCDLCPAYYEAGVPSLRRTCGLATVTRVAAADDGTRYDFVAIGLHWTTAVLVFVQFILSQTWGLFGRPAHHLMVVAHMSFGILLAIVILVRIIWRSIPGHQVPAIVSGWVEPSSKAVHGTVSAIAPMAFGQERG